MAKEKGDWVVVSYSIPKDDRKDIEDISKILGVSKSKFVSIMLNVYKNRDIKDLERAKLKKNNA